MDKIQEKADALLQFIKDRGTHAFDINLKESSLVKLSPKQCAHMCKQVGLEYHEGLENRVIQYRFTDATVDRHNEVIIPSGVDLSEFKRDPIILLQHNARTFPIGRSLQTKFDRENQDITGLVLFFDDVIDRTGVSEDTFRMAESGALVSGSIGFSADPEDIRRPSPEEREQYGLDKFGVIFDKIKLIEFSIVTVPANPNARQIASRKGAFRDRTLHYMKNISGMPEDHINQLKNDDVYIIREGDEDYDEEKIQYVEDESELEVVELDDVLGAELLEPKEDEKVEATKVQTLVFSKKKFETEDSVKKWLKDNPPFKLTKPLDENDTSWRARQRDPKDFKPGSFKTIQITDGVQAVIGKLKKAIEDVDGKDKKQGKKGKTSEVDGHSHTFQLDEKGNGATSENNEHVHMITGEKIRKAKNHNHQLIFDEDKKKPKKNALPIDIYIKEDDSTEVRMEKIELGGKLKLEGNDVTIHMFTESAGPKTEITNNDGGLSADAKDLVKSTLECVNSLKEGLEALLKSAEPENPEPDPEPNDNQNDLSEDDQIEVLYLLTEAERKLKSN